MRCGCTVFASPRTTCSAASMRPCGSEGLAINGHLPAKHLLHQAVRDAGFKVVLSGEGADEAFGGYAHLRIDSLRHAGNEVALRQLVDANQTSLGMMADGPALDLSGIQECLGFVPAYMQAKAGLGWRVRSLMHPEFLDAFRGRDAFGELLDATDAAAHCAGRHKVDQSTVALVENGTGWLHPANAWRRHGNAGLGGGQSTVSRSPSLWFLLGYTCGSPNGRSDRQVPARERRAAIHPTGGLSPPQTPLDAPPLCLFASSGGLAAMAERLAGRRSGGSLSSALSAANAARPASRLDIGERRAWDPALMVVLTTDAMQKWMDEEIPGVPYGRKR